MSIRTIIEINHDYLSQLERTEDIRELLSALRRPSLKPGDYMHAGVTVLGQRHHSEVLTVVAGGRSTPAKGGE